MVQIEDDLDDSIPQNTSDVDDTNKVGNQHIPENNLGNKPSNNQREYNKMTYNRSASIPDGMLLIMAPEAKNYGSRYNRKNATKTDVLLEL